MFPTPGFHLEVDDSFDPQVQHHPATGRLRIEGEKNTVCRLQTFFVSIDVSAIDPAEMAAAGRATANGMLLDDVRATIRHVCATKDIVGFEITDLAPMMDLSDLSVLHANAVLNACLNGIAVRKAGLDPDYVHPLALDHGQR